MLKLRVHESMIQASPILQFGTLIRRLIFRYGVWMRLLAFEFAAVAQNGALCIFHAATGLQNNMKLFHDESKVINISCSKKILGKSPESAFIC